MAFTQADIDRIDAEIASVEASVQLGDQAITKKRVDELMKSRAFMVGQMAADQASSGGRRRVSQIRMFGGKGF